MIEQASNWNPVEDKDKAREMAVAEDPWRSGAAEHRRTVAKLLEMKNLGYNSAKAEYEARNVAEGIVNTDRATESEQRVAADVYGTLTIRSLDGAIDVQNKIVKNSEDNAEAFGNEAGREYDERQNPDAHSTTQRHN